MSSPVTAPPRYALYYTPAHGSRLERFGASILGYDAYQGASAARRPLAKIDPVIFEAVTAEPRRYGFHATLKAPIMLADGCSAGDLVAAARRFAVARSPVALGRLEVRAIGRFLALVPTAPPVELALLAAECVAAFDPFRAPIDEHDRRRRLTHGLSARRRALLERWGYPYVFDEFRFHMTLTGSLEPQVRAQWQDLLAAAFDDIAADEVRLDALTILRQQAPGESFVVMERVPFRDAPGGR